MKIRPRNLACVIARSFWVAAPLLAFAASAGTVSAVSASTPRDASRAQAPDPQNTAQLKPVKVTGWLAQQGYNIPQTATATGITTANIDIPQSVYVIPRDVLEDQAAQSLGDAVRNVPGVYVQQGEGNRDEFYIRGVVTKSDFFIDGLRDDTEYFRDLYNVAHVDVLQGPAAILFGRGGAGGAINLVTRPAQRRRIRQLSVETGSWNHLRSTLDLGDAVGQSGAFRIMAMGEHSGGFRDHDYLHRYAVNPKFHVRLGERTEVDGSLSYLDDRRFADRGIPSHGDRPADVPRDRFFGSVDQNVAHSRVESLDLRIRHQLNDDLMLRNALLVTDTDRVYRNVYPGSPVNDQGLLKLKAYEHPSNRLSYLDRVELVAHLDGARVQHKLLAGASVGWQRGNDRENLPSRSKTLPGLYPVSDPTVAGVAFPHLDRNNHVIGKELGVYAEDQMTLGEHWLALLGARWDRFSVAAHYRKPGVTPNETHHVDTDWSPRVGLIYKPVANDSIYASVTRTFTPQGANIALSQKSPSTANLAPEKATNYEIGNKLDLFGGDLSLTAALFQLDQKDVVSNAADGSGRLVNTGRQRNRGVELSAQGALGDSWSVYANYTHLNAVITRATTDAVEGARVGLVPRNQFSLWARHALNAHWGIGAGIRGASAKYTSYDNDVVLPGFAEADAMAYYQADSYRVQLNVDNLTDRRYYATASGDDQIMPGSPRSVNLSVSMTF
jgi:catecholate siderophore receptor